jgi:hypothetical protein
VGQALIISPNTTLIEKLCCATAPLASATRTPKENVPTCVGKPEIVPAPLSVSPVGKLPEEIDHV